MTAVTKSLRQQHAEDEATIQRGMKTFWEMGEAYRRIRDSRSYHVENGGTHTDFKEYCKDRWGIGYHSVQHVIRATEIRKQLVGKVEDLQLPENPEQARFLGGVSDEERPEVWKTAVARAREEGRNPVGADVKEAVREHKARRSRAVLRRSPQEIATERAMESVATLRSRAEGFVAAVENMLERRADLPEHEAQSAAYTIVSTLHNVALLMEEAGVIQHSVASGVLSGLDEEIEDQEVEIVA